MKECQQEWKPQCRKRWESSSVVLFRDSGAEVMLCNLQRLCWHQTAWQLNWPAWSNGSAFSCQNAWIRIWHGHHQPVHQDIYNGTNSSKTHDDTFDSESGENLLWASGLLLQPLTSLTPTLQCNEPRSFFLLFYLHSAERDLSHTNTHIHTHTHSDTNRPRADWCCFTLGTLCSKGPHSHHCVCLGVLPIQDLPLSLTCLPDICIHLRLAGRC